MEVAGAIASVSQLLAYSFSVSKLLIQLAKDTETGPNAHRHKAEDIRLLEILIKDILKTSTGPLPTREEVLIPIFIQISSTICRIRDQLHHLRTSQLYRIWAISTQHSAICEEFKTLDSKRQILSLYLAQDIRRAMSDHHDNKPEPRDQRTSHHWEGEMGACKSKPEAKLIIEGNHNTAAEESFLNAGRASQQPLTGETRIVNNTNTSGFRSCFNAGDIDPDILERIQMHIMRQAPKEEANNPEYIIAVGHKLNLFHAQEVGNEFDQNRVEEVGDEVEQKLINRIPRAIEQVGSDPQYSFAQF